ncbi:hypothetical protein AWC38_SpisGene15072 [Stylophora pistillata]|uniref:Reverse transcriptase domain-containing protein n=1 Tax=Stylophora pistillata TaxID=50429 RepID=A0A2B4RPX3_STYPI|nr:hypothetical protein AWC38_SpisGene15072 [Stylophora pistillata]
MTLGQPIEFTRTPHQRGESSPQEEEILDLDKQHVIDTEIVELLAKGVITPSSHGKGEYISLIYTRAKKDGSFKCHCRPKIPEVSVAWKTVYVCFPNGLAFCPRKFTKLLKPVYSHLGQLGHLSASRIDDSYLQGDDYDDCERNVWDTVRLFDSLRFTVHPEKSSFFPQHRIIFMGFIIDSITLKVYPTSEKTEKIIHTCQGLLECPHPTVREVASTLGFVVSNFPAARLGPLHFRSLDMDKTEALGLNKGNFDAFMQLSELTRSDLQGWINSARSLNNPISPPQPEATLYTDATQAFHKELSGKHALVRIDNMTAVSDLENSSRGDHRTIGCAVLANSAMVAIGDETPGSGNPCAPQREKHLISTSTARLGASTTSEAHTSDLPLFRKSLEGRGLSESATSLILQSWRKSTKQQYKPFITKWEQYCCQREINPFSATIEHGINLLAELYDTRIGYSALNTARCALFTVCFTSEHYTFGQHPLVCRFLKGNFECRPSLPMYQETWDIEVVLDYLAKLGPPVKLSFKNLTLKVVKLMALHSGQRRETLHTLSIDYMQISSEKCVFSINSLLKTSRLGKHLACVEFQAYAPDVSLCIVKHLQQYLKHTDTLHGNVEPLLISYSKPCKAVSPDTISRWIKATLVDAIH